MAIRCKNYPECENTFLSSDRFTCGYCEDCQNENEAAYENYLGDFYGGSQPMTLREKQKVSK